MNPIPIGFFAPTGAVVSTAVLTSPSTGTRNNYDNYVGFAFTPTRNISVTSMGRWKVSGNSGTHTIGLFTDADKLEVPGGSVSLDLSVGGVGYQYADLGAPVSLTSGVTYIIASLEVSGGDFWHDEGTILSTSAGITLICSMFRTGPTAWGFSAFNTSFAYPNFRYT